jgi:hypothetical protein
MIFMTKRMMERSVVYFIVSILQQAKPLCRRLVGFLQGE